MLSRYRHAVLYERLAMKTVNRMQPTLPTNRSVAALQRCALLLFALLTACATLQKPGPDARTLLHDELFSLQSPAPDANAVFALSDEMLAYAAKELAPLARQADPRHGLIAALYTKSQLQLAYDGSSTRSASQAFASRSGNCLSLVIMTASFARHLGLPVSFQAVQTDDFYSRSGGLYLASGHVNLVLGPPAIRTGFSRGERESLTVDFLPQVELRGQRTRPLDELTIVAMYLNNRAAETLADGHLDEAYGYARAALLHDPGFVNASNTLGVIYNRAGHAAAAEAAFRHTLAGNADHVSALSNLVKLLLHQGRSSEAEALVAQLNRLQPEPPFLQFDLGRKALDAGDAALARDHFLRELRLQPYQDEVHFWAAQAYWRLGQAERAQHHLRQAVAYSGNRKTHVRYAAKLEGLRHGRVQ